MNKEIVKDPSKKNNLQAITFDEKTNGDKNMSTEIQVSSRGGQSTESHQLIDENLEKSNVSFFEKNRATSGNKVFIAPSNQKTNSGRTPTPPANYSPSNKIVSVNPLTGTANVVIPLYTIKAAHVSFPINLIYSATGIKAADIEGNAGLGWNVSLGGSVIRQLRGLPDDVTQNMNGDPATGWLYSSNGANIASWNILNDNLGDCNTTVADLSYMDSSFPPSSDTEPDIFSVNAPGLSCQLVFDSNHQIRTIPYQDIKVSYNTSPQGNSDQGQITSFTITNDQGITYTFGANGKTYQKSSGSTNPAYFDTNYYQYTGGITYYNAWNLTSITDSHNNSINLAYGGGSSTVHFSNPVQLSSGGAAAATLYTMSGTITTSLVTQIDCSDNYNFDSTFRIFYVNTPNSQKSCISLITGMGHNITFGYDNVLSTNGSFNRYFLSGVIDQNCIYSSTPPLNLRFQYLNTGTTVTGGSTTTSLASPASVNVDYWGYTNASSNNNTTLLPQIDINPSTVGYERYRNKQSIASPSNIYTYSISGANRIPDSYCTAGSLSQIIYGGGGYTTLSYSPNDYFDQTLQAVVQGGGIRISQITDHDNISANNDFVKTYSYTDPNTGYSSGKPISLPVFSFTTPYTGSNTGAALWASSTMISPVDLSSEDHTILYSSVTEITNNLGYSVYQYAAPAMNWDSSLPTISPWSPGGLPSWSPSLVYVGRYPDNQLGSCADLGVLRRDINTYPFPPNTNYSFERGQLIKVSNYNSSGSEVSETNYTYATPQSPVDIIGLKFGSNNIAHNYSKYLIHTSAGPLTSQVINKVFDMNTVPPGGQPTIAQITTTTNTFNNAQYKLTQQVTSGSDGNVYTKNIKYVKDYVIGSTSDNFLANILSLQNQNINSPIETYDQITPVNSTQALTTSADLVLFGTFNIMTGTQSTGPAPLKHLKFISVNGVSDFLPSTVSGTNTLSFDSRYLVKENDLGYDVTGFLLSKDDNFKNTQTTIPDPSNHMPRAVISGARYDEVAIDARWSDLGYSFTNPSLNQYNVQEFSRGGFSKALSVPANTVMSKVVNKNPIAANYIFSMWIKSDVVGQVNVSVTNGVITRSQVLSYDATTSNTSKYPIGWQYCQVKLPVGDFVASAPITISFSSPQNIVIDDVASYPENCDIHTYTYDSSNFKTSETDGNGRGNYFLHDPFGRLLTVSDQDNNLLERNKYINTTTATPSVSFSYSYSPPPYVPGADLYVDGWLIFNANTNNNPCEFNGNTNYTWDFGDGSTATTHDLKINHAYNTPNTYQVTLTVTSSTGVSVSYTTQVSVQIHAY